MKKIILPLLAGIIYTGVYAQSDDKADAQKEETKKEEATAKKSDRKTKAKSAEKETAEERHERQKEGWRRFGRAQRDFWKAEHEKHVANKEDKDSDKPTEKAETTRSKDASASEDKREVKREGPPKPPNPFKKKKKTDKQEKDEQETE